MAFQEVSSLDTEKTIQLGGIDKKTGKKNPSEVEGYFIGSKEVSSPKSKGGTAKLHILQTQSGNVGLWGKTDLNRKLGSVTPGSMVRISQNGQKKSTPNGEMYVYKVEVDHDNTIDVDSGFSGTQTAEDYETELDSTPDYASAPTQKAQVQALLNKGRRL